MDLIGELGDPKKLAGALEPAGEMIVQKFVDGIKTEVIPQLGVTFQPIIEDAIAKLVAGITVDAIPALMAELKGTKLAMSAITVTVSPITFTIE